MAALLHSPQMLANPPHTIVIMLDSYLENMGVCFVSDCFDFLPSSSNLFTISVRAVGICNGPFMFSNNLTGNVCSILFILGITVLANLGLYYLSVCQNARFTINLRVKS